MLIRFRMPGLALAALCAAGLAQAADLPATPKIPVTDVYHGVRVIDNYRWLEDANNPAVREWSHAQTRYARAFLDALPQRLAILERLKQLYTHPSPEYFALTYRRDVLFAIKREPPKEQPFLIALQSPDVATGRVLVDPNELDSGGRTAIDFYAPSIDAKYVAVSLSQGGSESGDLRIYNVATAKPLPDVIPRVNGGTAGGSVAWNADSSGFYYTRYPRANERPARDMSFYQQVYFHRLGTKTEDDTYAIGREFPRIAEIVLASSTDGRYILATVANGDGGEFAHYLLGPHGDWQQIARLADQVSRAVFGLDENLYLLSHQNAPRGKILRLPLKIPRLADATVVVPESEPVIESFLPAATLLYVSDLVGGPSQIRVFDLAGREHGTVPVKPVSSVGELVRHTGDELLFENQSYVDPPAWYRFDPALKKVARTALYQTGAADFSDLDVVREFAVSKDGTRVPLNILSRKGTRLDGNNPTVLYGYGGYSISLTPAFQARLRPLIDRGFVYVIANLRGGGEYGEQWHRAGSLTRKQNVFDDFAAAARHLIERKYTNPGRLAIEGGSNGGLLMGAALTQHPELFRAVVAYVGLYDMLRVELHPNGAFNVTEFGTVKEEDQFRALYAYSPYHHVVDGTEYPAVFFLTGDNDPRVDPSNSRKMAARLQASGTRRPILLRSSSNAGHGIGAALSDEISQQADVLAFLFDQLGVK